MNRFVFSALGITLFTTACGSTGSTGSSGTSGANGQTTALAYVSPCAPVSCGDSPSGDADGVATCSSASDGACGWAPGAPGSSPTTGDDAGVSGSGGSGSTGGSAGSDPGVTSFSPCDPSACPVAPAIACAPGYDMEPAQCGSLNGGACTPILVCTPHVIVGETCSDAECGAEEDIARLCDGGATSTTTCTRTTTGCEWIISCPEDGTTTPTPTPTPAPGATP